MYIESASLTRCTPLLFGQLLLQNNSHIYLGCRLNFILFLLFTQQRFNVYNNVVCHCQLYPGPSRGSLSSGSVSKEELRLCLQYTTATATNTATATTEQTTAVDEDMMRRRTAQTKNTARKRNLRALVPIAATPLVGLWDRVNKKRVGGANLKEISP
jgi:hypothetical protein